MLKRGVGGNEGAFAYNGNWVATPPPAQHRLFILATAAFRRFTVLCESLDSRQDVKYVLLFIKPCDLHKQGQLVKKFKGC